MRPSSMRRCRSRTPLARRGYSAIILGVFDALEMSYPEPTDARRGELQRIRERLMRDD